MTWELMGKLSVVIALAYIAAYLVLYGRWELNWWLKLFRKHAK